MSTNKLVRFVDFQVSATGGMGLTVDENRPFAVALFATYEPVRLWLKDRILKAPFRKLVVRLHDEAIHAPWDGHLGNVDGVCMVTVAVPRTQYIENASNHRWILSAVHHALHFVAEKLGWRSQEFEDMLKEMADKPFPFVHFFDKLARTDRRSGITCRPFMSFEPGLTKLRVRISAPGKADRDVDVIARPFLLYLDDDLNIAKSKIAEGNYLLLDKLGNTVASVPLHEAAPG